MGRILSATLAWMFKHILLFAIIVCCLLTSAFVLPSLSSLTFDANEYSSVLVSQYKKVLREPENKVQRHDLEEKLSIRKTEIQGLKDALDAESCLFPKCSLNKRIQTFQFDSELELIEKSQIYLENISSTERRRSRCDQITRYIQIGKRQLKSFEEQLKQLPICKPLLPCKKRNLQEQIDTLVEKLSRQISAKKRVCSEQQIGDFSPLLESSLPSYISNEIKGYMFQAGMILLLIIIGPVLIKVFTFYVTAPIADKIFIRRFYSFTDGDVTQVIAPNVSPTINIYEGEELLVKPKMLKGRTDSVIVDTSVVLDQSIKLSCIAAGMNSLTRVRTDHDNAEITIQSQTALDELSVIEVPDGIPIVIYPSNLVGVIKNTNASVNITQHWKFFRLSSWLTFQFRHLVIHGPIKLIFRGTKGVALYQVQPDKNYITGTVCGFTANLSYSSSRSETFWAYITGQQPLFKSKFNGGPGYVLQEKGLDGGANGPKKNTFEALVEIILKAFGL